MNELKIYIREVLTEKGLERRLEAVDENGKKYRVRIEVINAPYTPDVFLEEIID